MILQKSENPGSYERHLIRRESNPLFELDQSNINQDTLMDAQQKDHEMLLKFHQRFQKVLTQCVNLKPNEETDIIFALKGELEAVYTLSIAVADDQTSNIKALKELIDSVTHTLSKYIDDDPLAQQEFNNSQEASQLHQHLLQSKLVADLLVSDEIIPAKQLTPTLLSHDQSELALVLQLFDIEQLKIIIVEANQLLNTLDSNGEDVSLFAERLIFIEGYLTHLGADNPLA